MQDGTLTLRAREEDSRRTLALSGELDMSNAPAFASELQRLEASAASLELDLSGLEFIDSTGIAILVGAHQRLGDRLCIVHSNSPGVRRIFSLTGLDEQLRFRLQP
ncbi:MAG TPA: STAS domain-containing protein [Solirubrobacterales bacterium]|nr:STAS domain-containing protein [Solirubrobacterales bacterium]